MKHLILLLVTCFLSLSTFAILKDSGRQISMKGDLSINSVQVVIQNNFVVTTFNKAVNNVTVTVKKKTGEVIEKENLNAKTFDQVPVKIDNYKEGNYTIEIETEEGKLEGEF